MPRAARIHMLLSIAAVLLISFGLRPTPAAAQESTAAAPAASVEQKVLADRWYEIWLSGERAGWSRERIMTDGTNVTTESTSRMKIGRADQAVEISASGEFVETVAGEPIEVRIERKMGPTPVRIRYRFDDDGLVAVQTRDGVERETRLPALEGEWLPPAAAQRYLNQRLASGATRVVVRTLDLSSGVNISTVTRSGITQGSTELDGTPTDCLVADIESVSGPTTVAGREWFMPDGTMLRNELEVGGMTILTVASTREKALAEFEPPELMVSTFVRPDRRITDPRRKTRAVYRLRVTDGTMPRPPSSGFQTSEMLDDGSARVTINTRGVAAMHDPLPAEERRACLAATTYADADDAMIAELVTRALAREPRNASERAEAMRRFVYRHITNKDLGTAFATASEVARSCSGDCSEHGVLLAAMLRAGGIPSRVAVGVIYVERFADERHVFGYHMWTQALLETPDGPAWVDLDATLPDRVPFDATHIALATSDLAEGQAISQLSAIAPLLGTLEIVVEEAR